MTHVRHFVCLALLNAAPLGGQQRVDRFDAQPPTAAAMTEATWSPLDTHALTGLVIGGTSGALIGTLITGFGCLMVEASGYAPCTASGVLLGTWMGGSIGGGAGLLLDLAIPRDRSHGDGQERNEIDAQ